MSTEDVCHDRFRHSGLHHWLALAVGSLLAAGLFSLVLVIGRVPPFSEAFSDPTIFRRFLVVHVNLALVVWFYAGLAALFHLLPVKSSPSWVARSGAWIAALGVLALMVTAGMPEAAPILSNYVPMLDHPLFAIGLGLIAAGILLPLLTSRLLPGRELPGDLRSLPAAARPGLRAAAIAFVLGVLTCLSATWGTPTDLGPEAYYELLFWGGGHVLQFASVAAMLSIWLILASRVTGEEPLRRSHSVWLFGFLLLPLFGAPILAALDTTTAFYRTFFTRLMELGIFPVTTVVLAACVRTLYRARRSLSWRDVRIIGFAASAGLTLVGFTLGACIHGSNTLVPAHYHAALGGVTASLMTITFVLLLEAQQPGLARGWTRWIPYQPLLFGVGQTVFAMGFGLAGAYGMGRKTYGAEQQVRSTMEAVGLGVMGIGGVMAVLGGLFFLVAVISLWRSASSPAPSSTWRSTWETRASANPHFNG